MEKILLTAIFLFSLLCSGYSQDKIITLNNDTIDCKITKVVDNIIYFEVIFQGVKRSGKVDHNRIFKYIISEETNPAGQKRTKSNNENPDTLANDINIALESLLSNSIVDEENKKVSKEHVGRSHKDRNGASESFLDNSKADQEETKISKEPFKRLRFTMNGGPGYLLGSTKAAEENMRGLGLSADQADSYYKELKTGLYAGADLQFLITPNLGTGIKYKFFSTSASFEGFFETPDGYNLYYGIFREQIYVNFIGGTIFFQQFLGGKKSFKLNSACTFGSARYRNEASYFTTSYLLTGKHFGTDFSIGLEYFISPKVSVGTDLSLFYCSIRKMKITDGYSTTTVDLKKDNYENLSRLDLSLAIRVYLWNR